MERKEILYQRIICLLARASYIERFDCHYCCLVSSPTPFYIFVWANHTIKASILCKCNASHIICFYIWVEIDWSDPHLTWTWPYYLSSKEPNPVGFFKFLTYISGINIARCSPIRIGKLELHSSYFLKQTNLITGKCYLNKLHLENKIHMQASHKLSFKRTSSKVGVFFLRLIE